MLCLGLLWGSVATARDVRVGLYPNEPKIFVGADSKPAGIFVEILQAIAREEGWTLQFVPCEWQLCLAALQAGQLDLMPDVAYSEPREELFDFHRTPALHGWSQVYRRADVPVVSSLDLGGKRVAVLEQSIQEDYFANMLLDFGVRAKMVRVHSLDDAFHLVAAGGADVAIANRHFGQFNAPRYGLQETAILFQPSRLFFAAQQGRDADLLAAIDRRLEAWQKQPDSTYYRILRHWDKPAQTERVPPELWWWLGALCGVLLGVLGLAGVLRWQVRRKTRDLSEAREQLRATLDALPDLFFEAGLDGRIYDYRSPHADLLAMPPEQFLGKTFAEVLPSEVAEVCQAALHEAEQKGFSVGYQYELALPQGARWFELSVARKGAAGSDAPRFVVLARDISVRKTAELALHERPREPTSPAREAGA